MAYLFSGNSLAQIVSKTAQIMIVNSSGAIVDAFGTGGDGSGTSITVPATTTANAIAIWSGTSGQGLLNSNFIINGDLLYNTGTGTVSGATTNLYATNDITVKGGADGGTGKVDLISNGGFVRLTTPLIVPAIDLGTDLAVGNSRFSNGFINNVWASGVFTNLVSGTTVSGNQIFQGGNLVLTSGTGLGTITVTKLAGGILQISGASSGGGITGPTSTTNSGVAIWSSTDGTTIGSSQSVNIINSVLNATTMSGTTINNDTLNSKVGTFTTSVSSPTVSGTTINNDTLNGKTGTFSTIVNATTVSGTTVNADTVNSKQYQTTVVSGITTASTQTIDWNGGTTQIRNFIGGVSGTCTISLTNGIAGSAYILQTINNTSGTTSAYFGGGNIIWAGAVSGNMTAAASAVDVFNFYYNGNKWLGSVSNNFA